MLVGDLHLEIIKYCTPPTALSFALTSKYLHNNTQCYHLSKYHNFPLLNIPNNLHEWLAIYNETKPYYEEATQILKKYEAYPFNENHYCLCFDHNEIIPKHLPNYSYVNYRYYLKIHKVMNSWNIMYVICDI